MGILFWAFILSHGFNVLASFLMIFALIRLYNKTKISLVNIMSVLFLVWGITNLLLIIPNLFDVEVSWIALLNVIGSALAPSLFLLFADRFEGQISAIKTSVSVSVVLLAVFVVIVSLWIEDISIASVIVVFEDENLVTMRWAEIPSLFLFPAILLTGFWVRSELNSTLEHAIDNRQVKQLKLMKLGNTLTFFVGPLFGAMGVILVTTGNIALGTWSSEIVGYLVVSSGVFIFGFNYLISPETAFLKPQRVDTLLILHETGIPVMRYDFRPPEVEADTALISGAITAITAIMGEAFGVKSFVKSIHFEDKELMLEFLEDLAFILIVERASSFLETSLKRLKSSFETHFVGKVEFGGGEIQDPSNFIPIVLKSFGLQE